MWSGGEEQEPIVGGRSRVPLWADVPTVRKYDWWNLGAVGLCLAGFFVVAASVSLINTRSWVPWIVIIPPFLLGIVNLAASFKQKTSVLCVNSLLLFIVLVWTSVFFFLIIQRTRRFEEEWQSCGSFDRDPDKCIHYEDDDRLYCGREAAEKCRRVKSANYMLVTGTALICMAVILLVVGGYRRWREIRRAHSMGSLLI